MLKRYINFQDGAGSSFAFDINQTRSENLGKNLKVKVIIFDIDVLVDPMGSKTSSSSSSSSSEVIEPIVKIYDQSSEIKGISDVKTKYMNKIMQRIGTVNSISASESGREKGTSFIPSENRKAGSDATMLQFSNQLKQDTKPSRWLLKKGMGDILDYNYGRTVELVVLAREVTKEYTIAHFKEQLSSIRFAALIEPKRYKTEKLDAIYQSIEQNLQVASLDILLISSCDSMLRVGKDRGSYTCRWRGENDLFGQVVTDYIATSPLEVQDCIEDLNKVAFRNSVIRSRTF